MLRPVLRPLAYLLILVIFGNFLPPAPAQAVLPSVASQLSADALALRATDTSPVPLTEVARAPQPVAAPYGPTVSNATALRTSALARQPDIDQLPLAFFSNKGQTDSRVRFQAQSPAGSLFFTPDAVVLALAPPGANDAQDQAPKGKRKDQLAGNALAPQVVRVRFEGARSAVQIRGENQQPGVVNYLTGGDKQNWKRDLPTYAGLTYQGLYAGIDLHYVGSAGQLKGTYIVGPGADPAQICWRYQGAVNVQIDEATGDLLIMLPSRRANKQDSDVPSLVLREQAPIAWQTIGGQRVAVTVRYEIAADGRIGFAVGTYNRNAPLTIDPTLVFSTFVGGNSNGSDHGSSIAIDNAGNIYLTGDTDSSDFPTTTGAYDTTHNDGTDVFVTKLDSTGALAYSTFIGGSGSENSRAIGVDITGTVYLAGNTDSADFPTTTNAHDLTLNGGVDAFVTQLAATGMPIYSTLIGGSGDDFGSDLLVDATGAIILTGDSTSSDFPTTTGAYDTSHNGGMDAFFTRLDATGALAYSTFLGGSDDDSSRGISVDTSGAIYAAGYTFSSSFPTTTGAYDTSHNGLQDVFVAKLDAAGTLAYSTFIGGNANDAGSDVAVDGNGTIYITGSTLSSTFPTTTGAYDTSHNGSTDAFVTKLTATGTLTYSTFLGGSGYEQAQNLLVNANGIYLIGDTTSSGFPTTTGAYDTSYNGGFDLFISQLNLSGVFSYSTFLGGTSYDFGRGIAVDSAGTIYSTGFTDSSGFPTTSGAYDTSYNFGGDAFVSKFSATGVLSYSTFLGGNSIDAGHAIAIDEHNTVYLTGSTFSLNFPTTVGAYDTSQNGGQDVFVAGLDATGGLAYSTYIGGSGGEVGRAIAVGQDGRVHLTGETYSSTFPTTSDAFDTTHNGSADVFVITLASSGGLDYGTYLGGSQSDFGQGIAVDWGGNIYVTGETYSSDFPIAPGAYDTSLSGSQDAFVARIGDIEPPTAPANLQATAVTTTTIDLVWDAATDNTGVTGYDIYIDRRRSLRQRPRPIPSPA